MSRCAHAQSEYRIRQLPRCSKCKIEMQLVMVSYDNKPKPEWEWECRKCLKAVARHKLKEGKPDGFEQFLNKQFGSDSENK